MTSSAHRLRRLKRGLLAFGLGVAAIAGTLYIKSEQIVLGAEAYIFGYPLVMMDVTRVNAGLTLGPENHLRRVRQFPDSSFKDVVRPNVDTLYTTGFIDMAKGPWVFEMAANAQRYEVMPFMDGWTNVFATPGTRTTGTAGGRFLLAGHDWQGPTPDGLTLLRSPTRIVWLIGRTQTNGVADYPLVHRLQDGVTLRSLAAWKEGRKAMAEDATAWQPAPVKPLPPIVQMQALSAEAFFTRLAMLMVTNPPAAADAPMMVKLSRIGITPGQPPAWGMLGSLERESGALDRRLDGRQRVEEAARPGERLVDPAGHPRQLRDLLQHAGGGGHGRARGQFAGRCDLPEYPRRCQRRAAQREPPLPPAFQGR